MILADLDPERDFWSLREATPQLHDVIIHSFHGRHVDIDHTLFWCCQNGYEEGFVQILKRKPDLNQRIVVCQRFMKRHYWSCYPEETPLALAAANGHKSIVEILLKHGAKVKFAGSERYVNSAPIPLAASRGYHEITMLLFAQANPRHFKKRAKEANVALHALTNCSEFHLLRLEGRRPTMTGVDRIATMKVLLKEGADVKAQDFQGKTHLHHIVESAFSGNYLDLQTLLNLGLDPNRKNSSGHTPLHTAAARILPYSLKCYHMKLLARFGCDVSSKVALGHTPLHIAIRQPWVREGYWAGSTFHATFRNNVGCRCPYGKTPPQIPPEKDEDNDGLGIPQLLIYLGANVNCQDDDGRTPLHVVMETA